MNDPNMQVLVDNWVDEIQAGQKKDRLIHDLEYWLKEALVAAQDGRADIAAEKIDIALNALRKGRESWASTT